MQSAVQKAVYFLTVSHKKMNERLKVHAFIIDLKSPVIQPIFVGTWIVCLYI